MKRAPSIESFLANFGCCDLVTAVRCRDVIKRNDDPDTIMSALNQSLNMHGVECIGLEKNRDRFNVTPPMYLNSGDSYAPTILYNPETDSYRITTVGDYIETMERRGIRFI